MMSLKTREFTRTSVFSGMPTREIVLQEHLPYVLPIVFSTTLNNINWSIGLEVTLSVLGFTDIDTPTVGTMIFWANQHTRDGLGHLVVVSSSRSLFVTLTFIGLFLLAVSMNEYIDPRSRLARMGGARDDARRRQPTPTPRAPCSRSANLRAYYQMRVFRHQPRGARRRRHHASHIDRNEIYGLAGESSSRQDHASSRRSPRAIRPPLNVVGGSVAFSFLDRDIHALSEAELAAVRWRHLSYIMQGSMNVLNPVRRVRQLLRRLRLPPHRQADAGVPATGRGAISTGCTSSPRCSTPIRTSCRAACASASRSRSPRSAGPSSSSPTSRRPRSTWWCRRTCSAMMREVQREIGSSMLFVTHDMAVHANMTDRLGIMYAGRLVEEAPTARALRAARCIPTPRI